MSQYSHYICDTATASILESDLMLSSFNSLKKAIIGNERRNHYNPDQLPVGDGTDTFFDTFYCDLPSYFINSTNPNKEIQVLICRVYDLETGFEIQSSMHSDIVMINASADNYVAATNTLYNVPKRYRIGDNRANFKIWFRDIWGNLINLDPKKTRAIVELVLVY